MAGLVGFIKIIWRDTRMTQQELNRQCDIILEQVRLEILDPVKAIEQLKEFLLKIRQGTRCLKNSKPFNNIRVTGMLTLVVAAYLSLC